MLIGWWQPDADKPDTIIDNHAAVLDYALFAEGYAELKGYTLEGEPVDNWKGITRIRKTRETPPVLLFHGRLVVVPPAPDRTAFISVDEHRSKWYYYGHSRQTDGMVVDKFLSIPGAPFDNIVTERLKALERADRQMKDKLGLVDSPEEIEKLHRLLGNFEAVWSTFDLDQRQRAFRLLINRIAVESVSPHWMRLSIDWLDAISPLATPGATEALARQDMELHTGSGAGDASVEGSTQQG
jgi:hypothetical protein